MVVLPPATPLTSHITALPAALTTVAVKACVPCPACTLGPLGATVMYVGAVGMKAVRQGVLPALAGAVVVALVGLTITLAVSILPGMSVTVRVTVNGAAPLAGACTVTVLELAPETIMPVPLVMAQA